jgi:hypothetical protein
MVRTLVTMGFSFDDEPTVNCEDELIVARSRGGGKMTAAEAVPAPLE